MKKTIMTILIALMLAAPTAPALAITAQDKALYDYIIKMLIVRIQELQAELDERQNETVVKDNLERKDVSTKKDFSTNKNLEQEAWDAIYQWEDDNDLPGVMQNKVKSLKQKGTDIVIKTVDNKRLRVDTTNKDWTESMLKRI